MAKRKTSEIKPSSKKDLIPAGYKKLLEDLKVRIRSSQIKAALRVNQELMLLYWEIGKEIYDRQENEKWGSSEHKCPFAFVETMSFQALEFYEKCGFKLEYTRSGYSHNTSFHYLRKTLN